jgi:hypothetical protein
MGLLPTPKQPQPERLKDWYPYYAGFTARFAHAALDEFFAGAATLLDPWNGSGTTTAVAAVRGVVSTGIDVNPAMTVIARARLTPTTVRDSLVPIGREILKAGDGVVPPARGRDPLGQWLRAPAVETMRRIQHGIHHVVTDEDAWPSQPGTLLTMPEDMPTLAALYYSALFAVARDLLHPFRASNPAWLRYPRSYRHRLSPPSDVISRRFLERVQFLSERLTVPATSRPESTRVWTASAVDLALDSAVDGCLTSPPYATRIDYVRDGLAELAVLGLTRQQVAELRTIATGTPVVKGSIRYGIGPRSQAAAATLAGVGKHTSHGSANYYVPWLSNYFGDLDRSLACICDNVRAGGPIAILVQDSHYKTLKIDMQTIVVEMMAASGRSLAFREDYPVRHSMARMNPAARLHLADRTNVESLLVFS